MQRLGFIHDMLDVKVLILFVMSKVPTPSGARRKTPLIASTGSCAAAAMSKRRSFPGRPAKALLSWRWMMKPEI